MASDILTAEVTPWNHPAWMCRPPSRGPGSVPEPSLGRVPETVSKSVPEAGTGFTVGTLGGLYWQSASPKLPNSPPNGGRIQRLKI